MNDVNGELSKVLVETDAANAAQNYYAYGMGLVSQGQAASAGRAYPLEDGLGNVRLVTSSTGAVTANYNYDPFGNLRAGTGTAATNYRFSGEQLDPESSLYFLRARYYAAVLGRFISRDPVAGKLTNPQSQNPYAYAYNNSVNMSDPSGEAVGGYMILGGGLVLAGLETGGALYGGYNYLNSGSSCTAGGLLLNMAGGAQAAAESPLGQAAFGVAMVGTMMPSGKSSGPNRNQLIQEAQELYPNKANKTELHHETPIYLGGSPNGPTAPLNAAYHQVITNETRILAPFGQPIPAAEEVTNILQDVYSRFPLR